MGQADGNPIFTIDFDLVGHRLLVTTVDGRAVLLRAARPVDGVRSTHETLRALDGLDVQVDLAVPRPFDLPDSGRPFADDTEHATLRPAARSPATGRSSARCREARGR